MAGPGALRGAARLTRTGREAEHAATEITARDGIAKANRDAAHGAALADDAARTEAYLAATAPERARMSALETTAGDRAVAKAQAAGKPIHQTGNPPTAGQMAPALGRLTTPDGGETDSAASYMTSASTHTWAKHVVTKQEFPGVTTPDEFAEVASDVMRYGEIRQLRPGVYMYYKNGVVVVYDPARRSQGLDAGSVYPSSHGHQYL